MKFSSSALVALFCIGSGVDGARLRGVRSQRRAQADPALEVVVPGKVDVTTPLSLCQGDCDQDSDCEGDLICYQRDRGDPVPGCSTNDNTSNNDYCTWPEGYVLAAEESGPPSTEVPTTDEPTELGSTENPTDLGSTESPIDLGSTESPTDAPMPQLEAVGNNGGGGGFPLAECQGDCDNDAECQEGLVCMQRNDNDPVPGCAGTPLADMDFCVKPEYLMTVIPTSFDSTMEPSTDGPTTIEPSTDGPTTIEPSVDGTSTDFPSTEGSSDTLNPSFEILAAQEEEQEEEEEGEEEGKKSKKDKSKKDDDDDDDEDEDD